MESDDQRQRNHMDPEAHGRHFSSSLQQRYVRGSRCRLPKRYVQAMLAFLCFFIIFWMRGSFLIAVMYMMQYHLEKENELLWTHKELEFLDSSLYWSFAFAQIPAAFLMTIFSAHKMLSASVAISSVIHMLLSFALHGHVISLVIIRIFQGLIEAAIYPAAIGIWKHWAPPSERTTLLVIMFCGEYFGNFLTLPFNYYVIHFLDARISFCISGTVGLLCSALFTALSHEKPSFHPAISADELTYINESLSPDDTSDVTWKKIPWKHILTSPPVIAICIATFLFSWCFQLLNYFSVIYFATLTSSSTMYILLILPKLFIGVIILTGGFLADLIINKTRLSVTIVRKIFCSGGFVLLTFFLLGAEFAKNSEMSFAFITFGSAFLGLSLSGFFVNPLDLSAHYSSLVIGICVTFGSLADIAFPFFLEQIDFLYNMKNWMWAVVTTSIMCILGSILYAAFGSGEDQGWTKPFISCRGNSTDASFYPPPPSTDSSALVDDD